METAETIIYFWEKKTEKRIEISDMLDGLDIINKICIEIAENKFNEKLADQNRKREQGSL